ncbi:MAG: hypothetical protein IJO42_02705 [Clostridia bacterium]|nr:hypothetical protein [Clostridia bacterium]
MKKQQIQYRAFVSLEEVAQWVAQCYTPKELMELSALINSDTPLADYKGGLYRVMNQYLRLHCETYQSDYDIVGLQKFLLSKRLCESVAAFRFVCVKELWALWWNTRFGKEYEYPSFLSTTLLKNHYSMNDIKKSRIAIAIYMPQGTCGTYLPEVNSDKPEFEILLPYRLKIRRLSWNKYEIISNQ